MVGMILSYIYHRRPYFTNKATGLNTRQFFQLIRCDEYVSGLYKDLKYTAHTLTEVTDLNSYTGGLHLWTDTKTFSQFTLAWNS